MQPTSPYKFALTLSFPFLETEKRVRNALAEEKFGIISEIDIQAKLREKLGVDHPQHKILGACNPNLAYRALQGNIDVALALPCNVVLREEEGSTIVTAILPSVALQSFAGNMVQETAAQAEEALSRVFDALSSIPIP